MLSALFLMIAAVPTASCAEDAPRAARIAPDDPAPLPDKRPEIEAMLARFKAHVDKKGIEDRNAIEVIDSLLSEYESSGPKDRVSIVKELAKVFDLKRVEEKEGVPNTNLYIAAAVALGEMGPESAKPLSAAIDHKNLKKLPSVRNRLILSLGKTRDVKDAMGPLIDLLNDKDPVLVGAAGEALGEFSGADVASRKKAFEAMIKTLTAAYDNTQANINDTIARERYDIMAPAMITSLGKLSGHEERDPNKWRDWWNKNKGKNWDEL